MKNAKPKEYTHNSQQSLTFKKAIEFKYKMFKTQQIG